MTSSYRPQSDFAKKCCADGLAEGWATVILLVLDARGITLTEEARERITGCIDIDQLSVWTRRAATVDSLDALFE